MTSELFDGGNYVIYIPKDEWLLETSLEEGFLTDTWVSVYNDFIALKLVSLGDMDPEEAARRIREEKPGYEFTDNGDGWLHGIDRGSWQMLEVLIRSDGRNTFVLATGYPMEAVEGFGVRTEAMMESFAIK